MDYIRLAHNTDQRQGHLNLAINHGSVKSRDLVRKKDCCIESLLSCPQARYIYHTESVHLLGHIMTAVALRDITKGTPILNTSQLLCNGSFVTSHKYVCDRVISTSLDPLRSTWVAPFASSTYVKQAVNSRLQARHTFFYAGMRIWVTR